MMADSFGHSTLRSTGLLAAIRTSPFGASPSKRSSSILERIMPSPGRRAASSFSPASVVDTRREVRFSSLMPTWPSSRRTAWLTADCDRSRCAAARVKLFSSATTMNRARSLNSSRIGLISALASPARRTAY